MSFRPYRVNVLKYSQSSNLYFIAYHSEIRNVLLDNDIMYETDDGFSFDLVIDKLEEFIKDYKEGKYKFLCKIIEQDNIIEAFEKEIEYAKKNNKNALTYHIF